MVYASRGNLTELGLNHEQAMIHILTAARHNNARLDVTGALLFSPDCFAQTLEGDMAAVTALFDRIKLDTRHSGVVILQSGKVAKREFGGWSMAYAGQHDDERLRYEALTGRNRASGEGQVMSVLRNAILHASPALAPA